MRLDGKAVRAPRRYFGAFNVVLFMPEDLLLAARLARGPPAVPRPGRVQRRARLLRARRSAFEKVAQEPERAAQAAGPATASCSTPTTSELARTGARVVLRRRALVGELAPRVREPFDALHGDLPVALALPQRRQPWTPPPTRPAIRAALLARPGRAARARRAPALHGLGPHRDDLEFVLAGRLARELRLAGPAARAHARAEDRRAARLARVHGDPPILLLDDVSSELDPARREFLFEHVARLACQSLISITDRGRRLAVPDRVDFQVREGVSSLTSRDYSLQTARWMLDTWKLSGLYWPPWTADPSWFALRSTMPHRSDPPGADHRRS